MKRSGYKALFWVLLLAWFSDAAILSGMDGGQSGQNMLVARYGERHVVVRGHMHVAWAEFQCSESIMCENPLMMLWANDGFTEAEQAFALGLAEGSLTAARTHAHVEALQVPPLTSAQRADLVARVQALETRSLAAAATDARARAIVLVLEQLRGLWQGYTQNRVAGMPAFSEEDLLVLQFGDEMLRGTRAALEARDEFDEEWGCADQPPMRHGCTSMFPMATRMLDVFAEHAALTSLANADEFGRVRHLSHRGTHGVADEIYFVAPVLCVLPRRNLFVLSSHGLAALSSEECGVAPSSAAWEPANLRAIVAVATAQSGAEFRDGLAPGGDDDLAQWVVMDMKRVSRYREPEAGFLTVVEHADSDGGALVAADMSFCQDRPIVSHNVGVVGLADNEHKVWVRVGDELLDPIAQWFYIDCGLWRAGGGPSHARCLAGYRSFNYTSVPPHDIAYRHILDRVAGTFFVSDGIVYGAAWTSFMHHGWTRVDDPRTADAIWRRGVLPDFDNNVKKRDQLYNNIGNHIQLTTKGRLNLNLKAYDKLVGTDEYPHLAASQIQKETYVIYDHDECEAFFRLVREDREARHAVWIKKAASLAGGEGMFVLDGKLTDWTALHRDEYTSHLNKTMCRQTPIRERDGEKYIMQRYITNPLLIHGRKMELRAYWVILSLKPLLVVFREGGSLRNIQPWQAGDWANKKRHVSNTMQQGSDEAAQTPESSLKWGWDRVEAYFVEHGVMPPGYFHGTLVPLMKEYVVRSVNATRHKLRNQTGVFQLFRSDYMMDDTLHPWMSEVQLNPGKSTADPLKKDLIPHLMDETLNLVVEVNARKARGESLVHLHNMDGFEWVINEAAGYVFRAER